MFATPNLSKIRSIFVKTEHTVAHHRHSTLAVAVSAAALALVPVGAAFAATSAPAPLAHTATPAVHAPAHPATPATKAPAKTTTAAVAPVAAAPAPAPAAKAAVAAPAPAAPVAPAPADPYKTASVADLESNGLYGSQQTFTPSSSQWANAATITEVAKQRGMPPYAAVIAVAVAMQESSLQNLNYGDRDSLGLFQQRPSCGWGSPSELTTPSYAANAFLSALSRDVPNYANTSLWQAAQTVQESGFPTAYAQWQEQAAHMVHEIGA